MVKKKMELHFFCAPASDLFSLHCCNKLTVVQLGPNQGFVTFIFWCNCEAHTEKMFESACSTAFCQHDFGCSQFGLNSARPLSHPHCSPPSTSVCVFLFLCSHGISPHRHCIITTRRRSLLSCFLPHQAVHKNPKKLNQRGNGPFVFRTSPIDAADEAPLKCTFKIPILQSSVLFCAPERSFQVGRSFSSHWAGQQFLLIVKSNKHQANLILIKNQ